MDCDTQEKTAIRNVLEQIDVIKRFTEQYDDVFTFATTADEILAAHKNGKIASLIGKLYTAFFNIIAMLVCTIMHDQTSRC